MRLVFIVAFGRTQCELLFTFYLLWQLINAFRIYKESKDSEYSRKANCLIIYTFRSCKEPENSDSARKVSLCQSSSLPRTQGARRLRPYEEGKLSGYLCLPKARGAQRLQLLEEGKNMSLIFKRHQQNPPLGQSHIPSVVCTSEGIQACLKLG